MLKVGFIGWRGMVGSVLMQRMKEENDFSKIKSYFFSTSNPGGNVPADFTPAHPTLLDAYNCNELSKLDCIVTAQGTAYTAQILPQLRSGGFTGYWIDASSCLRMNEDNIIILDPINRQVIDNGLNNGIKDYSGGNCTVSLMLMSLGGLLQNNLIEWISSMTYQAASGAGANNMRELLNQSGALYNNVSDLLADPQTNILEIDTKTSNLLRNPGLPQQYFGAPLAGNVLPWIDVLMDNGQTKEEWKGSAETNKILGLTPNTLKIDGICVRVGSMRCHSQALTIKLKDKNLPLSEIESIIKNHNQWVCYVANNKADTLAKLTPATVSGTLAVGVGRLRKLNIGDEYLTLFTVGDQLLWGAAEPLRRMVNILVDYHVS